MAGNTSEPGATVTSRVLALLSSFDDDHRTLSLSQMADRAQLPLPTAHRLVGELVVGGAVERVPSGRYVVGQRLWDLGLLAPARTSLPEVASPYLHDLYGATLATVHLATRDGMMALYLDRLSGHASVPVVSTVGSRLPLHATGVGKALLAWAPKEVRDAAMQHLVPATAHTVTDPDILAVQLQRCRRDGYAVTRNEMSLGASSVAVPIFESGPEPVGALGIVVADLDRQVGRFAAALQVGAQGIRRELLRASPR